MGIYTNGKGAAIFTFKDKVMEEGVICYEDCMMMTDLFVYNNSGDNINLFILQKNQKFNYIQFFSKCVHFETGDEIYMTQNKILEAVKP